MYLDGAEEKMLRAIVRSAIASAAAGRPFVGEFRHYWISTTRLQVNEEGIAEVEARIVHRVSTEARIRWKLVRAARGGDVDLRGELGVIAFEECPHDGVHVGILCGIVPQVSAPRL
jgi:hypothetical protein